MKTTSEVQMIVEKIQLPMIVSVLIMGGNGLAPINHVLGLYKGMIIDGKVQKHGMEVPRKKLKYN